MPAAPLNGEAIERCRLPQDGLLVTADSVVKATREHFDCPTAKGAPLENNGGSGTQGSHWETSVFQTEMMDGSSDGVARTVLSNITLSLAEASGWYLPNYAAAGLLRYGFHAGCAMLVRRSHVSVYTLSIPLVSSCC